MVMFEGLTPSAAPKPQYFKDPAIDALYQIVLVLEEEVFTLRERLDSVIALHDDGQVPTTDALDALDNDAIFAARRQALVERLLEPLKDLVERDSAG